MCLCKQEILVSKQFAKPLVAKTGKKCMVFKAIKHSSGPPLSPSAITYPNYPPHSRREQLRSLQCAVKTCDHSALEPPGLRAVKTRARRESCQSWLCAVSCSYVAVSCTNVKGYGVTWKTRRRRLLIKANVASYMLHPARDIEIKKSEDCEVS